MTESHHSRRLVLNLDSMGLPGVGAIDWYDDRGAHVETLVCHAGPFESVSEFAQFLADQKPRSRLDKLPLF